MDTSTRPVLDASRIHPAARATVAGFQQEVLAEVRQALASQRVVVVGMAQNPYPRKARQLLDRKAVQYTYLEYGSYFSQWRRRLALKMWTGWPTLPMIFLDGMLIGGASDLASLIDAGEFDRMLAGPRQTPAAVD